jgi:hypothetical protein
MGMGVLRRSNREARKHTAAVVTLASKERSCGEGLWKDVIGCRSLLYTGTQ